MSTRAALAAAPAPATAPATPPNERAQRILEGPIGPTLARLAWPNVVVMLAQASTGLVETWWISRLGTDALSGIAVVFPVVMLMQMMSGGAIGGGISSAIARALGAGRRAEADALALHALVISLALGLLFSGLVIGFGRPLYATLGGRGASLEAAVAYSDAVFAGMTLLWVMNGFASIVRGTGNMLVPALAICGGLVLLVPLSPVLIFGLGPVPALGVAGGGVALLLYYLGGTLFLGWYALSGRSPARPRRVRLSWPMFREILRVGAVAAVSSIQTNLTVAVTTALVGAWFGPAEVAGFGTGVRLEYLLTPLVFGIGGALVAMVGMNVGAGRRERALRVAAVGGGAAFALTEAIGLAAALAPEAWLRLFDSDPAMLAAGSAYLRVVGPTYGFYGLGLALYFASQGAGRLLWPLFAGLARLLVSTLGGYAALRATGAGSPLYAALAAGLVAYGIIIPVSILRGAWFPQSRRRGGAPN